MGLGLSQIRGGPEKKQPCSTVQVQFVHEVQVQCVLCTEKYSLSVCTSSTQCVLHTPLSLVHGILQYTTETIRQIKEAWETILLEMDTKLTR